MTKEGGAERCCSPKGASGDTDETVRAQFGRESPGVVEVVVNERRELKEILMGVIDPRSARESEDGGLAEDLNSDKTSGFRAKEPARQTRTVQEEKRMPDSRWKKANR